MMTNHRFCEVCEAAFERRTGETLCSFLARKTCSSICLTQLHASHRISKAGGAEGTVIEIAQRMHLTGQCFAPDNLNLKRGDLFVLARPEATPILTNIGAYDSRYTADDM